MCSIFFCVFSLASKRPHKKSRRAFASRSLRLVESSTLVFDLTARSLPCRRARVQKETQRERERERERENLLRGETSIFELNKKILWKSTRAKTDHGVEGNRVARPRRVILLLERRGLQRNSGRIREGAVRAEENVYDGEAAFKAAAALTEAKGEAEKNERRNGARQTADATREKSSEQSGQLVRMRRSMQNGQRLNQSLQPVAKGLAVTAGSGSVRTKEVLQALHTATDKLERHHKLLQLALMREVRLEEKLKAEKDKVKKLQAILNSNTTLLPQLPPQSLPHTATLEQTNTIMVSTISSISNQAFEDGSNTLSTKRKIHLPTGSDESLQSPMKIPKQAHRDDVLENHGAQSQLPSTAQYFVRKSGSSTKPKCTLDVRAPPSSSLPRGLHSPVKPPRFEKLKDVLMRAPAKPPRFEKLKDILMRLPTIRNNEA